MEHAQRPAKGEEIELEAAAGAIFSVLPRELLQRLGVRPTRQQLKLPDGSVIERETGLVKVELRQWQHRDIPVLYGKGGDFVLSRGIEEQDILQGCTRVIFGEKDETPVLGTFHTREALELRISPVSGKLEPVKVIW